MSYSNILIFGEVLFDFFGDIKILGGAPFNLFYHLTNLQVNSRFITAVGDDDAGNEIKRLYKTLDLRDGDLQTNAFPTGAVQVSLINGEPSYEILEQRAYDHIQMPSNFIAPENTLLYHGTLALRSSVTYESLCILKNNSNADIFFDINLRPPYVDAQKIKLLLEDSDYLKLNADELLWLSENIFRDSDILQQIFQETNIKEIILTKGADGAEIITREKKYTAEIKPAKHFIDSVGAGDAFCAGYIYGLSHGASTQERLEYALHLASAVCDIKGAISYDKNFYKGVL